MLGLLSLACEYVRAQTHFPGDFQRPESNQQWNTHQRSAPGRWGKDGFSEIDIYEETHRYLALRNSKGTVTVNTVFKNLIGLQTRQKRWIIWTSMLILCWENWLNTPTHKGQRMTRNQITQYAWIQWNASLPLNPPHALCLPSPLSTSALMMVLNWMKSMSSLATVHVHPMKKE